MFTDAHRALANSAYANEMFFTEVGIYEFDCIVVALKTYMFLIACSDICPVEKKHYKHISCKQNKSW